ncbi:alkyl sulfatase dimerization domain-containing protein [Psychromonas aquimarina]|uniref:alkyl sulfatase dimerization domain-containing protein n=1 Tax=Psychromonas aquimarina TaxID=444919 RepID=UPI00146F99EA|nr:alkyl sulfatase dimerization domain-containing protein [Psychromonas aquimarina]
MNPEAVQQIVPLTRLSETLTHTVVAEGVYQLWGPFYAPAVIETDEGLIVLNTGEDRSEGKHFRDYIRKNISDKPVLAIFYDHAHYMYGAEGLADGDNPIIVGHPIANELEASKGAGGIAKTPIPELLPVLNARTDIQFAKGLPLKGADAPSIPAQLTLGESAFMPVTLPVADQETVKVGPFTVTGYHHATDSDDSISFYFHELDLVFENVLWPHQNTYTLRGDSYRDPNTWMDALKELREINPAIVLNGGGGAAPLVGKEKINNAITSIVDSMAFVYDQSIRMTNKGIRPDQLKHHISLPESTTQSPFVNDAYGQAETFYQAFPTANAGYFSGYADELHNLPNDTEANYLIEAMGGEEAVFNKWQRAQDSGKHLWAKQLATYLYHAKPNDKASRQALADSLRSLGQLSPGMIARNFYMSAVHSLEGNSDITVTGTQSADWAEKESATAVDYLRTRINPDLAADKSGFLVFEFENGDKYGLDIRNSIAEFVGKVERNYRKPTEIINVSTADFAKYYAGESSAKALTKGADNSLLYLFEEFSPTSLY